MAAKDAFANVEGILINSEEAARLSNARKTADEESSRDQRLRIFQEGEESRKEILLQGFDFTVSLINQALQAQQNAFASQFESLRIQEEQRLALVGDNEQEQQKIREEFAKREADLKKQQAQADKRNSLFQIAINTAQGVIAALSQFPGPPATIPFAAIVAAQGAIQAAVVAATPIPQFAEGVIGLQGPGTETSDSIPAFLSKNESVMTGEETRKFRPTLEAIRKKIVSPEVLNSVAVGDHLPDVARQSYISAYNGLSQGLIPSATFEDINASIQANFNANSERMSDKIVDGLRRYRSNVNLTVNASGINVGW